MSDNVEQCFETDIHTYIHKVILYFYYWHFLSSWNQDIMKFMIHIVKKNVLNTKEYNWNCYMMQK